MDSHLEPPEGRQPCPRLDSSPGRPVSPFRLQDSKIRNACCFKPLSFILLWLVSYYHTLECPWGTCDSHDCGLVLCQIPRGEGCYHRVHFGEVQIKPNSETGAFQGASRQIK